MNENRFDDEDAIAPATRWLRFLKLVLTVIVLGITIWNALAGSGL